MMFFKQRKSKLANGERVREGSRVSFINSDGDRCDGVIERDKNNPRRLFFWNNTYEITDYKSAFLVEY